MIVHNFINGCITAAMVLSMRFFLSIFCICVFVPFSFAQIKYSHVIEYTLTENLGFTSVTNEYLLMDGGHSFYFSFNKDVSNFEALLLDFDDQYVNNRLKYFPDEQKFSEVIRRKSEYFSEDFPEPVQWNFTNDTKDILGFACAGATGTFRGRTYKVWFTNEIPFSYGPWKLNGLPGTILEAEDHDHYFHYIATRVVINKEFMLPETLMIKNFDDKAIPYQEFIAKENAFYQNLKDQVRASYPIGTRYVEEPLRVLMKELMFEWEKEPLK